MVEKVVNPDRRNVVDFATYRRPSQAIKISAAGRRCRHCGAALLDDESEDDCSSAGVALQKPVRGPRRFRAD
jgi:hypothetical protein